MAVQWQARTPGIESPPRIATPCPIPELTPLIDGAAQRHQVEPNSFAA